MQDLDWERFDEDSVVAFVTDRLIGAHPDVCFPAREGVRAK